MPHNARERRHIAKDLLKAPSTDTATEYKAGAAQLEPTFGLLVPTAKQFGIGRTTAFALARSGLLATFLIGRRRYVKIESLKSLPDRLVAQGATK